MLVVVSFLCVFCVSPTMKKKRIFISCKVTKQKKDKQANKTPLIFAKPSFWLSRKWLCIVWCLDAFKIDVIYLHHCYYCYHCYVCHCHVNDNMSDITVKFHCHCIIRLHTQFYNIYLISLIAVLITSLKQDSLKTVSTFHALIIFVKCLHLCLFCCFKPRFLQFVWMDMGWIITHAIKCFKTKLKCWLSSNALVLLCFLAPAANLLWSLELLLLSLLFPAVAIFQFCF